SVLVPAFRLEGKRQVIRNSPVGTEDLDLRLFAGKLREGTAEIFLDLGLGQQIGWNMIHVDIREIALPSQISEPGDLEQDALPLVLNGEIEVHRVRRLSVGIEVLNNRNGIVGAALAVRWEQRGCWCIIENAGRDPVLQRRRDRNSGLPGVVESDPFFLNDLAVIRVAIEQAESTA